MIFVEKFVHITGWIRFDSILLVVLVHWISKTAFSSVLDTANNRHPNVKLDCQTGKSVPFLDVLVENQYGMLT